MLRGPTAESDMEITLEILRAIEKDESVTQRSAAENIGVALGLVNTYFKRCIKKGLIKVKHAPANRYAYYLTPRGFYEKSRLTAEFLRQSLSLYRQAQQGYQDILQHCLDQGWRTVGLVGVSDLAEILALCSKDFPISIAGIIESDPDNRSFYHAPIYKSREGLGLVDAYVITTLQNPQSVYDELVRSVPADRIQVLRLLGIQQKPSQEATVSKGRL